ncbi:MAG: TolC family protein [Puniceicoccales bacterium]|jgi:outer membrane protein TolC|nr:TolC family protein [Puniceicoccales bacterium]
MVCGFFSAIVALMGGCASVDSHVSASSGTFWTPPERAALCVGDPFGNASGVPEGPLDLPTLVATAFENSPATKKSWQAARIAAAQSAKASSVFFPRVSVAGTIERVESSSPQQAKTFAKVRYPSIEVQCSIFQFGGHAKSAEAARQLMYAANYQHNRALQTLAHCVQKCYFALDSAECAVEASERNLMDATIAYDAAFVRHQSGLSNIQDFLQAKANKSRAEFELGNAVACVEAARASLANAIGVPVSGGLRIIRSADENAIGNVDIDVGNLITETVQTRSDILASRAVANARKNAIWSSSSKLMPELVVGGAWNRKSYGGIDGNFNGGTFFAALRWTLFDGFSNVYDMVESRAKWKQAEQDFKQLALSVASDVWEKYHAFKSSIKLLHAARNCEQASQESFDSIVISYKNGLSSFSDLMSSQTQLASARQKTIAAKNNLSVAVVDLAYAVGVTGIENAQK